MAKESDVYVRLKLDSKDFMQNMAKSKKSTKEFVQEMEEGEKKVKNYTIAIGAFGAAALAVVKQVVDMNNGVADSIELTERYSRSTGIATKDLLGLNLAMKSLGVDVEEGNEGLKTFAENIGDAIINQAGPAQEALNALGISIESLKGKGTEEQFLLFAAALNKIDDASQRTFLSIQAGGEDFDRMNKLFEIGDKNLRALVKTHKDFSNSLDLERIKEYNTALKEASTEWEKLKLTASPFISDFLSHWLAGAEDKIKRLKRLSEGGSIFNDEERRTYSDFSRADHLDTLIETVKMKAESEKLYQDQLKKTEDIILKNNKATEDGLLKKQKQRSEEIVVDSENKNPEKYKRTALDNLLKQFLIEDTAPTQQAPSLTPRFAGLLERGSQAEVSARGGEANEMQKQQTQYLKEIAEAQKKRERQFKINNVSF
jgi:hypothetical protein